jgi:hypothetical protein
MLEDRENPATDDLRALYGRCTDDLRKIENVTVALRSCGLTSVHIGATGAEC